MASCSSTASATSRDGLGLLGILDGPGVDRVDHRLGLERLGDGLDLDLLGGFEHRLGLDGGLDRVGLDGLGNLDHGLGLDGRLEVSGLDALRGIGDGWRARPTSSASVSCASDLGERGGEGRVDPALRFGQRVRRRVAPLRSLPALAPLAALAGGGRRGGTRLRHRPDRTLLGLLEAEAQAMALGVQADDLQLEDLALVHHVARVGNALVGQLADVDESLEALADPDEGAEVDELRDRAVDDVADVEVRDGRLPRDRAAGGGSTG